MAEAGDEPYYPQLGSSHFLNRLSMQAAEIDGEAHAAVDLPVTDSVTNHIGALQGGITAVLVDIVAGTAVTNYLGPGYVVATQDLSLRYLDRLRPPTVRATARVVRAGRTSVVVEAQVAEVGGDQRVGVIATACFSILDRPRTTMTS